MQKLFTLLFAAGLCLATGSAAWAQDAAKGQDKNKDKASTQAAADAEKERREKDYAAEKQRSEASLKTYQQQARPAAAGTKANTTSTPQRK